MTRKLSTVRAGTCVVDVETTFNSLSGSGLNCDPDTGTWVLYNTGRILVNNTRDSGSHIYNTGWHNTSNSSIVEC